MSGLQPDRARARAASAAGRSPRQSLVSCLDQLDPLPPGANCGIVYMSEAMGEVADEVVRALRERTGIADWFGTSGAGAIGPVAGHNACDLAVLALAMPAGTVHLSAAGNARARADSALTLAHGEWNEADPGAMDHYRLRGAVSFDERLVGGLVAARRAPVLVGGDLAGGATVTLSLAASRPARVGVATAGSTLGEAHRVTSVVGGEILSLDGRPALSVVDNELGDLFRHARSRFLHQVWLAEPGTGRGGELRTRPVAEFDLKRGSLRVRGDRVGPLVTLMRPDPAGSLERVRVLARDLRAGFNGAEPCCALYLASRHRGTRLFGPGGDEVALLREELGPLPLVGLVTDAEVFGGVIHEASAILVLLG